MTKENVVNKIEIAEFSPEKAGVGGSIPSLTAGFFGLKGPVGSDIPESTSRSNG